MDQKAFQAELERDGYAVMTNTTPGAKVNPEHTHPFDVKAMVLQGALTLSCDGQSQTFKPGEIFTMQRGCLHSESYGAEGAMVLVGRKA